MKRCLLGVLLVLQGSIALPQSPRTPPQPPSLVLAVVVDQLRYDYLLRHGHEFKAGLRRLLQEGAVLTNAQYEAVPTVTAIGHSTFLSGATPSVSGIAGNSWYSRREGRSVQSITDTEVTPLGTNTGASPRRLLVTTVGDELKSSGKGGKVYGVSLKDRAAILPAGHAADGAFWMVNGNFVSSSWYFQALPAWVEGFNAEQRAARFLGASFLDRTLPSEPGQDFYRALDATPYADQLVLEFALHLMQTERLGRGSRTDLLAVSFSAMDYLGHASGADTPQMREMVLSIDAKLGELLQAAERQAGRGRVLLVFTSDHGVSPVPEENIEKHLPGGRYSAPQERATVSETLTALHGEGEYILASSETGYYLNYAAVKNASTSREELENTVAEVLRRQPHVARVYTRTALERGMVNGDRIDQRIVNGFNRQESGDIVVVRDPYWLGGRPGGTTHGSPYAYDTHVPVIFWGPPGLVKRGRYHGEVAVHDIAPTLATLLGIGRPSGAMGRVLHEIMP